MNCCLMDRLTDAFLRLLVSHCYFFLELEALGSNCSGISVYICILQKCCIIVIIYDASIRILYFFLKDDMDLVISAVLYKSKRCLIYMIYIYISIIL